jgi:cell wall-associated NlpC family hydrolase
MLCSFVLLPKEDPSIFQPVFDRMQNDVVKSKLLQLEKEGVQKEVNTSEYDIEKVIQVAEGFLGTRHQMGGTKKTGIDCSGLVMVSHQSSGITLPHQSHQQSKYGKVIAYPDSLKRGDLVFFYASYNSNYFITHSGIYLGDNQFIHATVQTGVVKNAIIGNSYWGSKFLFGTRLKQ